MKKILHHSTLLLLFLDFSTAVTTFANQAAFVVLPNHNPSFSPARRPTPPPPPPRREGHVSWRLFGQRMKFKVPSRLVAETEYIQVDRHGENAWKTMDCVPLLQQGGVGIVPTGGAGYGFVTPLFVDSNSNSNNSNKLGLERLLRIKGLENCKKPLSLLVSNIQTCDEYCLGVNDKRNFKILKKNLPGDYTFIFPAKTSLPKGVIVDGKGQKHAWKRHSLGIRMPADPVLRYLQDDLLHGMPLLVSSLPVVSSKDDDDDDIMDEESKRIQLIDCTLDRGASWCNEVDFIVDAGARPCDGSTIFDFSQARGEPILVREGLGPLELVQ